ncbi:lipocalin family protein [Methylosarcina fibrata]|uniref:lipocalin family protein n=1 Tax=Methylosarcina fibrata TaxID=105972 RepID=UPI000372E2F0|nr:lipocalin family protein [Methylosarcina fibrata]
MKKTSLAPALLALSLFTSSVLADIELKSKDEIAGTWKLQYTKNSATAKENINREDTWVFKDGKVTILNIPREGSHYDQQPVTYEIDNGKLKIPYVGRSGFDTFSLVEINDKAMVLKGKFGEIYYFTKK